MSVVILQTEIILSCPTTLFERLFSIYCFNTEPLLVYWTQYVTIYRWPSVPFESTHSMILCDSKIFQNPKPPTNDVTRII